MAKGFIPDSDIAAIREQTAIEEVIGDYVQLTPAGVDSLKGLSPFKDEKTPSFHVRPMKGYFHCFSTGEGGDVFSFLMKMEHISFPEAVEQCADRIGYRINWQGGTTGPKIEPGTRKRLVEANKAAHKFYMTCLEKGSPLQNQGDDGAERARNFLFERGFTQEHIATFGCGYSPQGWDTTTKHLLRLGFQVKELEAAGITRMGQRGPVDRFNRRLMWPIRNAYGDVIGFGGRKLYEDDQMGKYMNTPETILYKKSKVLFGLDLAKKNIATSHQAVVVEGYTDVMAMHAAGIDTAVAACGTAFGSEHLQILRRFMLDDKYYRGEIIYTFDGDEAGKKAALKAFDGDQEFSGLSYVTVAPDSKDPCDIRMEGGDKAVRDLVARRKPLFEFVLKSLLEDYDLYNSEGRVQAMRRIVPVLAGIKDEVLRNEYCREAAGWIGWDDVDELRGYVLEEAHKQPKDLPRRVIHSVDSQKKSNSWSEPRRERIPADKSHLSLVPEGKRLPHPDPHDVRLGAVRDTLKFVLQEPQYVADIFDELDPDSFEHPSYIALAKIIAHAGGSDRIGRGAQWVSHIASLAKEEGGEDLVSELAVEDIACPPDKMADYASAVLASVQERFVGNQIAELKITLRRKTPDMQDPQYRELFEDIVSLENYRRSLKSKAVAYSTYASSFLSES